MEKMAIVIVNWNTGQLLSKCLESLSRLSEEENLLVDEVIVVDNESHDNSIVAAEVTAGKNMNNPAVRFVKLSKNAGFAKGNNEGLARIYQRHGDYIHTLLLNPDTEVKEGALKELVRMLKQKPKAGIVGAKLLNPDGSLQASIRNFPSFKNLVLMMLKMGRLADFGSFDYSREQKVEQVMGAAFLIRDQVLKELGGLDEGFWVWYEEVDYCRQAAQRGWEVWYTPRAEIVHYGAVSFNQLVGWRKTVPWMRSLLHYAEKHLSGGQLLILRMMVPVTLVLSIPAGFWHRVNMKK